MCYSNRNVKFENFMHCEWREEKFVKGIVGEEANFSIKNHLFQKIGTVVICVDAILF